MVMTSRKDVSEAEEISRLAGAEFLRMVSTTDTSPMLRMMVETSVMRAFGCTCRHVMSPTVYFEDITCSLHGTGLMPVHPAAEPTPDPGE